MRIEIPHEMERLGAVIIHSVQKVYELDAGLVAHEDPAPAQSAIESIPYDALHEIEKQMAIVVPMRGERIKLVEGVLCGIPNHCLTIILSNSPRSPVDRFAIERDAFLNYCRFTQKRVLVLHQKDPALAQACLDAGYPHLVDPETGLVRDGKAEGMLLATIMARLSGVRYLGFVDADNYFPGAVLEYIREYAAGFFLSRSPFTMTRIAWHSKPKVIEDGLFFAKWGRTSRSTNHYLNSLIAEYTGFETELIRTGNAGEHALSMNLALLLDYSSGYSIEPYHYINMFEKFGGLPNTTLRKELIQKHVEIFQIESRNPHMHDVGKGDEHIEEMTYAAMQVIYHSPICPKKLQKQLLKKMREMDMLDKKETPAQVVYYPALHDLDFDKFLAAIATRPYAQVLQDYIATHGDRAATEELPKVESQVYVENSPAAADPISPN